MDKFEFAVGLMLIVAFVVGVWIGADGMSSVWEKDCEQMGKHRADGTVYICSKAP